MTLDDGLVQRRTTTSIAETDIRCRPWSELPQFVKDEFDAFVGCGILSYGGG